MDNVSHSVASVHERRCLLKEDKQFSQFTSVGTAAHRRTCRTTAFRPPVLHDTRQHLRFANRQLLAVPHYRLNTYIQPSGLFSGLPHSLELSARFHPGPDHMCRLFQTFV